MSDNDNARLWYSPHSGGPYVASDKPITATQYRRKFKGIKWVWLFNPWDGALRSGTDTNVDPFGLYISAPAAAFPDVMEQAAAVLDAQPVPAEDRMVYDPETQTMHGVIRDTANPKDAAGRAKVALWLLSPVAKAAWAAAAYLGQVKYGAWNYRGTKVYASVYISAAMRHLDAYLSGETYDPEDGTHHLGNVMACCAILLDTAAAGKLIDDRPPRVDIRPSHNEVQTLMPKIDQRYADREPKPRHWTINDEA